MKGLSEILLDPRWVDWLPVALDLLGLALLGLYHLYLARVSRVDPERTFRGRSNRLRRAWVATVRQRGEGILAVQTTRNWVMSATLFASTSILIGLAIGNVAFSGAHQGGLARSLGVFPAHAEQWIQVKLLVLAAIFFTAFHQFALALRYYNHTGFMINLPDEHFDSNPVETVARTLNRAGGHYNRGTRIFLLAMPFSLWLIGPLWFLGGVAIILFVLVRFDFRDDIDADAVDGADPR
jgi:uncharacterized membrane protein